MARRRTALVATLGECRPTWTVCAYVFAGVHGEYTVKRARVSRDVEHAACGSLSPVCVPPVVCATVVHGY